MSTSDEVPDQIQRFHIRGVLGRGAMGTVYRAHDPQLDRDVAIKVVSKGTSDVPATVTHDGTLDLRAEVRDGSELFREARVMAQLSHPHVLAIYEVGLVGESVFLVMELVVGASLREWLATDHTVAEIADVLEQAARGLAAAHARGIIHRDFKLDNVLVGEDGRARVGDFGISRLLEFSSRSSMTRVGEGAGGTPGYIAPEVWAGQPASAASDCYALGVSCVEAFTAHRATDAARMRRDLVARAVPLATIEVLMRAIADDPAQRPSALEIAHALRGTATPQRGTRRVLVGALALVGLAGAGAGTFVIAKRDSPTSAACETSASLLGSRWTPISRTAFSGVWIGRSAREKYARLMSALDASAKAIEEGAIATCRARQRGEVTVDDEARRTSCLQRRAFELGALVTLHRSVPTLAIDGLLARVDAFAEQPWCEVATGTRIGDAATSERLHTDYVRIRTTKPETQATPLAELEVAATAAKEEELAIRVAINLGDLHASLDRMQDADKADQRAYKLALEARMDDLAALALTRRSSHEFRKDPAAALRTAELALELIDRPGISLRTKVRAYAALGRAQRERSHIEASIVSVRTALKLAGDAPFLRSMILAARSDLVNALSVDDRTRDQAVEEAREYVRLAKAWVGEKNAEYGTALNVLALALYLAKGPEFSLPYRQQSLAVMEATLPANHSRVIGQRTDLASDLQALGRSQEAYVEFKKALELSSTNESSKTMRANYLGGLASSAWGLGRGDEALRWVELSVQSWIETRGSRHDNAVRAMRGAADMATQLGKLDTGAKYVQLVEEAYAQDPDRHVISLATFRGTLAADLALAQRNYRLADKLTREAIATLDELKRDNSRALILWRRGEALIGVRKFAAAREALALARTQMVGYKERADRIALVDLAVAKLDRAEGNRAAARAGARKVLEVLADYPGQPRGRREAAALGR